MNAWERCEHALRIGSMYTPGLTVDDVVFLAQSCHATASYVCRDNFKAGRVAMIRAKIPGLCRRARNVYWWAPEGAFVQPEGLAE